MMKKLLGIVVLGLLWCFPVHSEIISKDKSAYRYLPESVAAFPEGNDFLEQLDLVGFSNLKLKKLSGGIATIYSAKK